MVPLDFPKNWASSTKMLLPMSLLGSIIPSSRNHTALILQLLRFFWTKALIFEASISVVFKPPTTKNIILSLIFIIADLVSVTSDGMQGVFYLLCPLYDYNIGTFATDKNLAIM